MSAGSETAGGALAGWVGAETAGAVVAAFALAGVGWVATGTAVEGGLIAPEQATENTRSDKDNPVRKLRGNKSPGTNYLTLRTCRNLAKVARLILIATSRVTEKHL